MLGGALFLTVAVVLFEPLTALSLHALTQFTGNTIRIFAFRKTISFSFSVWYVLGIALAIVPSIWAIKTFSDKDLLQPLIGFVILLSALISLFAPEKTNLTNVKGLGTSAGFISLFVGSFAGAVGPVVSSFFIWAGLRKERLVGTKAFCQAINHLTRIILYSTTAKHLDLSSAHLGIAMIPGLFLGTAAAKRCLPYFTAKGHKNLIVFSLILFAVFLFAEPYFK